MWAGGGRLIPRVQPPGRGPYSHTSACSSCSSREPTSPPVGMGTTSCVAPFILTTVKHPKGFSCSSVFGGRGGGGLSLMFKLDGVRGSFFFFLIII